MLAQHIAAEFLQYLDVVAQRSIRRRRVQPIRPPALVKRAELKQRFIIQKYPRNTIFVFAQRDFPHTEIAAYGIDGFAFIVFERYFQLI